jgi:hypothetical protein
MSAVDLPSQDPNWLRKVGQVVEKPKETKKDEE